MRFIKNIIFGFQFLIVINVSAQWDLKFVNDSISFRDFHFFDTDTGIAVGIDVYTAHGLLLKTVDGGVTWDTIDFPDKLLWSIDFPSRDTGYISISNPYQINVMRSIDGGATWAQTTNNLLVGNTKMDIDFYNNDVGVLSIQGFSWKTIDAGMYWNLITSNPNNGENEIFIDDTMLFGIGGSFLIYSYDTCNTYDYVYPYSNASGNTISEKGGFLGLSATGQSGSFYGYGHNNFGVIATGMVSTMNFNVIHFPYPQLYSVRGIDKTENYFYAVAHPFNATIGSHFLKSSDGINWFRQESSEPGGVQISLIEKVKCLNDSVCFAYGGGRFYRTDNGGGPLLQQIGVQIVGLNENELENTVSVYPNPFDNYLIIESEQELRLIQIYNISGKLISVHIPNQNKTTLNLNLERGIYLMKIQTKNGNSQHKITKM